MGGAWSLINLCGSFVMPTAGNLARFIAVGDLSPY
jgi:hypothetical protein